MENIYYKTKIVFILVALHETKCTILQFPEQLESEIFDFPILNFKSINQSILYLTRIENDSALIFSILKEAYATQPVLLLSGKVEVTLRDIVNNKSPNIILLTESLNIKDLETGTFKNVLFAHWSALYLVITTRSQNFICKNGTLTNKAFTETKKYLNELWQVYRIVRVSVTFPYTCPKHYVIYDGKELSGTDLYNRDLRIIRPKTRKEYAIDFANSGKLRDLTIGYPLHANIFYRIPTSITECDVVRQFTNLNYEFSKGFCGLDGMVMNDFIKHYKYQLIELEDESCDKYGYEKNNRVSGSLACVLSKEIDISFNSRFIWLYTSKRFHFLHYVSQDTLCVAMKRPNKIPLWHYPINMFTFYTWIWLLLCISSVGVITWIKGKILAKLTGEKFFTLRFHIFNALHSAFFGVLLKNDGKFRILKGTSLLCSIILLSVYQGHINNQFTTRSHYPEIKSTRQLYATSQVIYTQQSILNFILPSIDPSNEHLLEIIKHIRIRDSTSIEYLLQQSKEAPSATLERKRDTIIEVIYNHTDKYGKPEVYLLDMPYGMFYLSFIVRDDFLFLEESQMFMMRLTEAGLPNRYYKWTGYTFTLSEGWPRATDPEPRPSKMITVKRFQVAYAWLLAGYFISGFVFIVERWGKVHGNCFCCKKPEVL